ncbi:hypothetical protein [Pedobacter aquatilis]|uniref:hypothetical protein n=1 Tax=Pedobacter aquatilis TaxID=351343 RepID=UPI0029311284|nr:hypothetical protein [Pedobacter aquatilis]
MKLSIFFWITSLVLYFQPTKECKYRFIIDKQNYFIEEAQLNDIFGFCFQEIVNTGNAKQKDFELWSESYATWRQLACQGTYQWDVYYNKIANATYSGTASNSDLGIGDDGKTARGNPNKKQNHAHRMAYLNYEMRKQLTYFFTQKKIQ